MAAGHRHAARPLRCRSATRAHPGGHALGVHDRHRGSCATARRRCARLPCAARRRHGSGRRTLGQPGRAAMAPPTSLGARCCHRMSRPGMVAEPGRLIGVVGTIGSIALACALLKGFLVASHSLHSRVLRRGSCDGMAPPQLRRLRSARHVGLGPGEGLTPVVVPSTPMRAPTNGLPKFSDGGFQWHQRKPTRLIEPLTAEARAHFEKRTGGTEARTQGALDPYR